METRLIEETELQVDQSEVSVPLGAGSKEDITLIKLLPTHWLHHRRRKHSTPEQQQSKQKDDPKQNDIQPQNEIIVLILR